MTEVEQTPAISGKTSDDPPFYTAEFAAAPLDKDFYLAGMTQMAHAMRYSPTEETIQTMLDIFRRDGWTNSDFRCACEDLLRTTRGFPYYADFCAVRD